MPRASDVPEEKTEAEIQAEIQSVFRQITASVTFLPMLDGNCTFNVLVYADADSDVPLEWGDSDAKEIKNGEKVQLRSFSSSNHRVDTLVSYRYVESNTLVHVLGLIEPGLAISTQSTHTIHAILVGVAGMLSLRKPVFYPVTVSCILDASTGILPVQKRERRPLLRVKLGRPKQSQVVTMFSLVESSTRPSDSAARRTLWASRTCEFVATDPLFIPLQLSARRRRTWAFATTFSHRPERGPNQTHIGPKQSYHLQQSTYMTRTIS